MMELRAKSGEDQVAFAARLGITQGMLSLIESGKTGIGKETLGKMLTLWPDLEADVIAYLKEHCK